ncbi:ABC transporter ATP-binding protein [Puniceibacterium sediminis]|uniref:Amino acid/amide ABC transporter ATP-binding protein 2, HAAT family n=1 Tax=Puniceibacterium sediminis TaxID=1608407 RepID=A0A238VGD6_9RHOB|nr:ABC transporter ATP-binding protein [Puniceibacterium sediminis]SNR33224.1 amino acid/amide ABC transporter ATP-binding protein 2, HAAT family [Puniceibacterium sediminis]
MILEIDSLHSGYGKIPILMGVTLNVAEGEFLGILGHNGMGKTTLMNTLMGHLPATSGTVRFNGQDITRLSPHKRSRAGLGLVPQGRQIFPDLSVHENLRMGMAGSTVEDPAFMQEILSLFPRLHRLLDRRGGALSGGEQQLLALARCLCSRPKLMLLDEPTEGIQPSILEEIVDTLKVLRERGLSLVLVEQNLEFIAALSGRVLTIQKGVITGEMSPKDLQDPEMISEFVGMSST